MVQHLYWSSFVLLSAYLLLQSSCQEVCRLGASWKERSWSLKATFTQYCTAQPQVFLQCVPAPIMLLFPMLTFDSRAVVVIIQNTFEKNGLVSVEYEHKSFPSNCKYTSGPFFWLCVNLSGPSSQMQIDSDGPVSTPSAWFNRPYSSNWAPATHNASKHLWFISNLSFISWMVVCTELLEYIVDSGP